MNQSAPQTPKKSFLQDFKDQGFIIGHTTASCTEMMVEISNTESEYFAHSSADHSSHAFACDPNYVNPENNYGFQNGPNGIKRRCLYKNDYVNYLFNYTYDFWNKYQEEKKLMIVEMNDGHDSNFFSNVLKLFGLVTTEVLQYWDIPGSEFLKQMEKENLLNDTIILLIADHGEHMNGLYRFFLKLKECIIDISLPMLYISFPQEMLQKKNNTEIIGNLNENSQKLVTINNVHHFLKAIALGLNYSSIDQSLFANLPPDRDCTASPILPSTYCACESYSSDL